MPVERDAIMERMSKIISDKIRREVYGYCSECNYKTDFCCCGDNPLELEPPKKPFNFWESILPGVGQGNLGVSFHRYYDPAAPKKEVQTEGGQTVVIDDPYQDEAEPIISSDKVVDQYRQFREFEENAKNRIDDISQTQGRAFRLGATQRLFEEMRFAPFTDPFGAMNDIMQRRIAGRVPEFVSQDTLKVDFAYGEIEIRGRCGKGYKMNLKDFKKLCRRINKKIKKWNKIAKKHPAIFNQDADME